MIRPRLLVLALVLVCAACATERDPAQRISDALVPDPPPPAELVLRGGRIVTMDPRRPEADALAARGGRIVAVGSAEAIAAHIGPETRVVELAPGQLAVPGLIDCHAHLLGIGAMQTQLDLTRTKSWAEIVALVAQAASAAQPGELIRGRGWHQDKWIEAPEPLVEGLPTHAALSAASPENPVLLTHASGHMTFANAKAMELAAVRASTPDPSGGTIVRDESGEPIGAFRETAAGLLGAAAEGAQPPDPRRLATLAIDEVLSKGVTTLHDAGSSFATIDVLRGMADRGELRCRLWVMVREPNDRLRSQLADYAIEGLGDDRLTVRAIKRGIDGALGSHGAWLLEPYADLPASAGLNTEAVPSIAETAAIAAQHEFQLCVHAIGDRANRETLDVFAATFRKHPERPDWRWRVEHAQHLHPLDVPRFAELEVIASMQGVHCTSDAPFVAERLGPERAESGAYVWRALLDAGALVVNGTDAPVEDVDPIACFFSSVTRELDDGSAFYPAQRMSRVEALRSYTIDAAYAGFEEDVKGSLEVGKLADVTVLSQDVLAVPDAALARTEVDYTIVGGRVEYERAAGSR